MAFISSVLGCSGNKDTQSKGEPVRPERTAVSTEGFSFIYQGAPVTTYSEAPELAKRVAACAFKCLWHPAGYFCYQQTRLYRNQIKYLRWADAWMFRGLASLVSQGTPNSGDTD